MAPGKKIVLLGGPMPSWFRPQPITATQDAAAISADTNRILPFDRLRAGLGCLERSLRRRQAGNRQPVRGARHVIEPDLVAELDRRRVAAVLAADADLQLRLLGAARGHR